MVGKLFSIIGVISITSMSILLLISLYNERSYGRRLNNLKSKGYTYYQADSIIERQNIDNYSYPWIIQ